MGSRENRHQVGDILVEVGDALGPFILEVYKVAYSEGDFLKQLTRRLRREDFHTEVDVDSAEVALAELDVASWLSAMIRNWDLFELEDNMKFYSARPDFQELRSYIYELRRIRNKWAHPTQTKQFTDSDVLRISDTAARVLRAVLGIDDAEDTATSQRDEVVTENLKVDSSLPEEDRQALETVDVSYASLSGLDLRGRNLRYANLADADLSGSNMQGEDFSHSSLAGANLADVDMQRCKFDYADLHGAKMSRTNLAHAHFYGVNLASAVLVNVHAPSAHFSGDMSRADFTDATMEYVRIDEDSNLSYVTLKGADMGGAHITWAEMPYADLTSANMQWAKMYRVNLTKATLSEANLSGAEILFSVLKYADLRSANLSYAKLAHPELEGVDWTEWDEDAGNYWGGEFNYANLANANLESVDAPYAIFRNADLMNAKLTGANLQGSHFQDADLTGAKFCGADLSAANLSNTNLLDADFFDAELNCATLTGAKFRFSTRLPDGSYWDEDTDMTKFTGPAT